MKLLLMALLVACAAFAQTPLPAHFTGFGMGFQNSAIPKTSGWSSSCVLTANGLYPCLSTDYTGGVGSIRAEAHQFLYQYKACAIFGTGGAGAATSVTGGVGGSFDAGGVLGCKMPQKLVHYDGIYAVFSGSWQKNNVMQAADLGTALRAFGAQTIWRFGFGKGW